MTEYRVSARRIDNHGSLTVAKEAKVVLDTDMAMWREAMNLVELGSAFCWAVGLNTAYVVVEDLRDERSVLQSRPEPGAQTGPLTINRAPGASRPWHAGACSLRAPVAGNSGARLAGFCAAIDRLCLGHPVIAYPESLGFEQAVT